MFLSVNLEFEEMKGGKISTIWEWQRERDEQGKGCVKREGGEVKGINDSDDIIVGMVCRKMTKFVHRKKPTLCGKSIIIIYN